MIDEVFKLMKSSNLLMLFLLIPSSLSTGKYEFMDIVKGSLPKFLSV